MRWPALALALSMLPAGALAADDDVLLELHFKPVAGAQIAIWIVDANGEFVQDVLVTQATGTLGIGNRPGRWDFPSSWRFPYGPRPQVLPVWAHVRGSSYPALRWLDDDGADQNSLGWHENSSSTEPFFCRPLTADENVTISTDTMTCPSPGAFATDKGRIDGANTSPYPPRNDLVAFNPDKDSADVMMYGGLNDLDAITSATPPGDRLELVTAMVPREVATAGPITAWLEVNLEGDQSPDWSFDRELDHYVDPRLPHHGIAYIGQPSVVYKVELDAMQVGFVGTDAYVGYGDWQGRDGTLYPPDATIAEENGSGAARLARCTTTDGEQFRFAVYAHGDGDTPGPGVSSDDCESSGPMGGCSIMSLPAATSFALEPVDFDRVAVDFTVPELAEGAQLRNVKLYYRAGEMPIAQDNLSSAIQRVFAEDGCTGVFEPGETMSCELDQLFGNFTYQVGLVFEDGCSNESELVAGEVTTPRQPFQTVEGVCFVATAAWGEAWSARVSALRWFRDLYLRQTGVGMALVQFYYANSPLLARAIAPRPWARALARSILTPLTDIASATTAGRGTVVSGSR